MGPLPRYNFTNLTTGGGNFMHKICLSDIVMSKFQPKNVKKNNSLNLKFWFMLSLIFLNDSHAYMFRHLYNFYYTWHLLASDGQTDSQLVKNLLFLPPKFDGCIFVAYNYPRFCCSISQMTGWVWENRAMGRGGSSGDNIDRKFGNYFYFCLQMFCANMPGSISGEKCENFHWYAVILNKL